MEERNDMMPVCPLLGEPAPEWMDGLTWEGVYDPLRGVSRVRVDTGVAVHLSLAAGAGWYSPPSTSFLPWREYERVEIAIIVSRTLARPEAVGLGEPWTDRFEPGNRPVLPYLPVEQVPLLVNDIINAAQKEG